MAIHRTLIQASFTDDTTLIEIDLIKGSKASPPRIDSSVLASSVDIAAAVQREGNRLRSVSKKIHRFAE